MLTYTPQPPVPIDPTFNGQQAGEYASSTPGPFVYQQKLYSVLVNSQGETQNLQVYQALSGGQNWQPLNAQAAPTTNTTGGTFAWFLDFANSRVICCVGGSDTPTGFAAMFFQDFSLQYGTWGTPYGLEGSPLAGAVQTLYMRVDGTYLVVTFRNFNPSEPSGNCLCFVYNPAGANWVTTIDVFFDVTAEPGGGWVTNSMTPNYVTSCMDPSGNIYLFGQISTLVSGPPYWNGRVLFAEITLANTVENFNDFPGQNAANQLMQSWSGYLIGVPVFVSGTVYLPTTVLVEPVNRIYASYWYNAGSGWNLETNIDPGVANQTTTSPASNPGMFASDGTTLYLIYPASGPNFAFNLTSLRLIATPVSLLPAGNWTGGTIYQTVNPQSNAGVVNLPLLRILRNRFLLITADTTFDAMEFASWFGDFAVSPIAIFPPPPVPLGWKSDCKSVQILVPKIRG